MAKAHVLVLPFPAQGHVTPLMELSHRLVDHGFEVTFVNTQAHHSITRWPASTWRPSRTGGRRRRPQGHQQSHDAYTRNMPGNLEQLIAGMETAGRPKVKWLVSDVFAWWSFDVAKRLGIRVATFCPASAGCLAINLNIPKLTEEGLLNNKG
ncbi:unnamed protein product [Urochloa humidicola]